MTTIRVGTRQSALALIQTQDAIDRLVALFPEFTFMRIGADTPGDRDRLTDLRESPPDFFTRDLDTMLRNGAIDCAIHSAKDLPPKMPEDIDWFWLPWREDPRDVWVLPRGVAFEDLPATPTIGVSSARRAAYCETIFPDAVQNPVRGTIEERLAQLDAGRFDALIMAGAALRRLNREDRVTRWIPLEEMPVPDGQGVLAVTFLAGDARLQAIRARFVKAVRFVSAGAGSYALCTVRGVADVRRAEVCLYDALMDERLLQFMPSTATRVFVGKRCGEHTMEQSEITTQICDFARRGVRVVRLKGGDAGCFGRLAEEVEALEALRLPYVVRPGVSALSAATTGTGMLLTRRGVARGFTVMTPRAAAGEVAGISATTRERLPLVLFMAMSVAADMALTLLAEGWPVTTPVALVFNAGADDECIVRGALDELSVGGLQAPSPDAPGLVIIGSAARYAYAAAGRFVGRRVLLTCSEAMMEQAEEAVTDAGGRPVARPFIQLTPRADACEMIASIATYDWVVLTSPAAIRIVASCCRTAEVDVRTLPKMMVCGVESARVLRETLGVRADVVPAEDFSAAGLIAMFDTLPLEGARVLRLRSAKAGGAVAAALRASGATVDDVVLYDNTRVTYDVLPPFDDVFFASASAVESFLAQFGMAALNNKTVRVLGGPTAEALKRAGRSPDDYWDFLS